MTELVKATHSQKTTTTEMTEAMRFAATALSSPNVTVLSLLKPFFSNADFSRLERR